MGWILGMYAWISLTWVCMLTMPSFTQPSHVVYKLESVRKNVDQQYRTGYHFQPQKNWMNGPMLYKGVYHLFYQYNPEGAIWGNIVWGHAVSKNLIEWRYVDPPAIVPSEWYDIKGCWSGSATFLDGGKPAILYTGWNNASQQMQSMVLPKNLSDPLLREWVKIPQNPIITPTPGINGSSFRDPTTGWRDGPGGKWRILIGSKRKHRGMALLYRSRDFIHWEKAKHPLHSSQNTGMWECPDFYPVALNGKHGLDASAVGSSDVKHVLKVSLDNYKYEYYTVGKYLVEKDRYIPDNTSADNEKGLRYDYGKFYASKTFFDSSKHRRILWGWINESDSTSDDVTKGWAGVQAIPRTIWLKRSRLVQWPVPEVESLRRNRTYRENIHLQSGSVEKIAGVKGAQVDVEVSFELPTAMRNAEMVDLGVETPEQLCRRKGADGSGIVGPFGLLVLASDGLHERTAVFFRIVRYRNQWKALMCSDQSRSSLQGGIDKSTYGCLLPLTSKQKKSISLRILVDNSIVESFGGGGKCCITARVYPTLAVGEDARLYVFNNGTSPIIATTLNAWEMASSKLGPYT
eukprot:Gb_04559 [translate_table: standard]